MTTSPANPSVPKDITDLIRYCDDSAVVCLRMAQRGYAGTEPSTKWIAEAANYSTVGLALRARLQEQGDV